MVCKEDWIVVVVVVVEELEYCGKGGGIIRVKRCVVLFFWHDSYVQYIRFLDRLISAHPVSYPISSTPACPTSLPLSPLTP